MNDSLSEKLNISINEEIQKKISTDIALDLNVIITTKDKLHLCLLKYQKSISVRKELLAPLGPIITIITTLNATEFKPFLGFEGEVWEAVFIILAVLCIIWFVKLLCGLIGNWKKGTIELILNEFKSLSEKYSKFILPIHVI